MSLECLESSRPTFDGAFIPLEAREFNKQEAPALLTKSRYTFLDSDKYNSNDNKASLLRIDI